MSTETLTLPVPSTSATDVHDLARDLADARRKGRAFLEALQVAAPNPRDYGTDANAHRALAEHRARAERLRQILRELDAVAEHVADLAA